MEGYVARPRSVEEIKRDGAKRTPVAFGRRALEALANRGLGEIDTSDPEAVRADADAAFEDTLELELRMINEVKAIREQGKENNNG